MYLVYYIILCKVHNTKVCHNESIKLLSLDKIGDFLNLLPISRENLRKTDPCLGSFATQSDPSEWHICTMVDIGSVPPPPPGTHFDSVVFPVHTSPAHAGLARLPDRDRGFDRHCCSLSSLSVVGAL